MWARFKRKGERKIQGSPRHIASEGLGQSDGYSWLILPRAPGMPGLVTRVQNSKGLQADLVKSKFLYIGGKRKPGLVSQPRARPADFHILGSG